MTGIVQWAVVFGMYKNIKLANIGKNKFKRLYPYDTQAILFVIILIVYYVNYLFFKKL